jgi:hypothetical protein
VKRTWTALTVAALLGVACSAGLAQQSRTGTPLPQTYVPTAPTYQPNPNPSQSNPDPAGLVLAAFGTAAAVGHVMRQKRRAA